jgi:hypothetical protein
MEMPKSSRLARISTGTLAEQTLGPPTTAMARISTGTLAEQTLGPPTTAMACFFTGNNGGQGLAALPDGGAPSIGHNDAHGGAPSHAFPQAPWPSHLEHYSTADDGAHGGAPSRTFSPCCDICLHFSLELSAAWRKCHEDRMALEDYIRRLTAIKHLT